MLLLWFFFFAGLCSFACDVDSFVYEEFGQRCLRLADYIKQLQLAYRLDLPDQDKNKRQLLNEWTSFYLDHGQAPPPGISGIATATWQNTISAAGIWIGNLSYRRIAPAEAFSATVPFILLSQPGKLQEAQQVIASWSEILAVPATGSIEHEGHWIGRNIELLSQLTGPLIIDNEIELARISQLVREINLDWKYVITADPGAQETVLRFSRHEIRDKLKREFAHWARLSFM